MSTEVMEKEAEKEKIESRTEMSLEGSLIDSVTISPTGIKVYRKGGGIISITPRRGEPNKMAAFNVDYINKA
jgi:hypothetical protein